jgi:hypothetical protein
MMKKKREPTRPPRNWGKKYNFSDYRLDNYKAISKDPMYKFIYHFAWGMIGSVLLGGLKLFK